jgi:hypothetical protein
MSNLSPDQFSNPKPYFTRGGQGKLFRDPKPVDEHRYQRGYTPDRMRDVKSWDIDPNPGKEGTPYGGHGGAHRILETIARSTTPASDFPHDDDKYPLRIDAGQSLNSASGTYQDDSMWSRGRIALAGYKNRDTGKVGFQAGRQMEERVGQTLMHELGHYRSKKVERNPHSYYSTPTDRGKEEAFADDNEVSRFRPDPRDVRRGLSQPVTPSYESVVAHYGIGGKKSHAAYLRARKTPLQRPAQDRERLARYANAAHQPDMFKGHDVPGYRGPKGIPDYAQPVGPLHPMQFGKI